MDHCEHGVTTPHHDSNLAELVELWDRLTPYQQKYHLYKAKFYTMQRTTVAALIVLLLFALGFLVAVLKQNPVLAVALLLIGAVIGIIVAWESERRK